MHATVVAARDVTSSDDFDLDLDIDGVPAARDATLAWDDELLVVRAVAEQRDARDEGRQERVFAGEDDVEIELAAVIAMRAIRPWPALELEWRWPGSDTAHRLVMHPRGVHHPVPRTREVLASYERFGEHVERLFDHVPRRARLGAGMELARGWLDDRVVAFEPVPTLPAQKARAGPYRVSADGESLLVHTKLPAALMPRVRDRVSRLLHQRRAYDGLSALALSQRFVWVVKRSGLVMRIPRDEMRGLFVSGERFDLAFGRSTFLSVALPMRAPIRAALLDAAHEAAARMRVTQRIA